MTGPWYKVERDGYPEEGVTVLVYAGTWKDYADFPYSILDGEEVCQYTSITHWCYINEPTT